MTVKSILKKVTSKESGESVIVPIDVWHSIEEKLEEWEILSSKKLPQDIAQARKEAKEGKLIDFEDLKE